MYMYFLLAFSLLPLAYSSEVCLKSSDCSCETTKYGVVSLKGIADSVEYLESADHKQNAFSYRLYPCGIKEDWGEDCTVQSNAVICQRVHTGTFEAKYRLGRIDTMVVQSLYMDGDSVVTTFNYSLGSPNPAKYNRSSEIALVCDYNANKHVFEFIEEKPLLHYKFKLTSREVCPSLMDRGCKRVDPCTCLLNNGKGFVTVHGVLEYLKREWLEVAQNGAYYALYPCQIKANSTDYKYCADTTGDPAACMVSPNSERFTLGLQSQVQFTVSTDSQKTTVVYHGGSVIANEQIKTTLILKCDMNVTVPKVEVLGQNPWLVYDFSITSKELCPHW